MNTILSFRKRSLVLLATAAVLGGCASIDTKECKTTDWYNRGVAEGNWGAAPSLIDEHTSICAKAQVVPDKARWQAGYAEGVKSYCTANSGWNRGAKNEVYRGACINLDEPTFLRYHTAGQQLYRARQELNQIDSKRKKLQADYNFTTKDDVRRRLKDDLARADREYTRLMALVAAYELAGPPR